jgi:3-hydroxyisobutyrate dehydrogenase-like beta-hydroxyacid dehydrogenase
MAPTIGILHPGQMGSSLGACARASGADVVWAVDGRSDATAARARADGLREVADLAALAAESDVVISVCPPDRAQAVAQAVAGLGYSGVYVDVNAIGPRTARSVGEVVEAAGARFVDGGVIGPPARGAGTTWLHLSGAAASEVAGLFADSALETRIVPGPPGAASALKMAFASYTKGHSALLLAVRALARSYEVENELLEQWGHTHPRNAALSEATARATAPKAWRFVGEMHEIATTYAEAGLPDGFHRAAADIYRRMERFKHDPEASLDDVLAALAGTDD